MRPKTSYLICATHRTGSTLLCETLKSTGLAGQPEEYFWSGYEAMWSQHWGCSTFTEYLASAVERTTTPNGVFGAKIMWAYLEEFLTKVREIPEYTELTMPVLFLTLFPNLSYVWITRRDKVRQAVSLWKAVQTQLWEYYGEDSLVSSQEAVYDFQAINSWLEAILRQEAAWHQYFDECGVTPFTIVYEDLATAYEVMTINVLRYLDIYIPAGLTINPPSLKKQADTQSEEWVQRFIKEKKRVSE